MSGTLVPMGTGVPAGTHRNLENLGTAGYRVPGKFWKLGTGGYRVPGKFSLMPTPACKSKVHPHIKTNGRRRV